MSLPTAEKYFNASSIEIGRCMTPTCRAVHLHLLDAGGTVRAQAMFARDAIEELIADLRAALDRIPDVRECGTDGTLSLSAAGGQNTMTCVGTGHHSFSQLDRFIAGSQSPFSRRSLIEWHLRGIVFVKNKPIFVRECKTFEDRHAGVSKQIKLVKPTRQRRPQQTRVYVSGATIGETAPHVFKFANDQKCESAPSDLALPFSGAPRRAALLAGDHESHDERENGADALEPCGQDVVRLQPTVGFMQKGRKIVHQILLHDHSGDRQ
jgi:hypothetical protein